MTEVSKNGVSSAQQRDEFHQVNDGLPAEAKFVMSVEVGSPGHESYSGRPDLFKVLPGFQAAAGRFDVYKIESEKENKK